MPKIGDEASIEGSTSSFSKGDDGIVSAKIPQSADSSISVTFAPEKMKNCSERLTILADFKFALDNSTKLYVILLCVLYFYKL